LRVAHLETLQKELVSAWIPVGHIGALIGGTMSSSSFGGIGGRIARTKEKKLKNRAGSAKHSSRAQARRARPPGRRGRRWPPRGWEEKVLRTPHPIPMNWVVCCVGWESSTVDEGRLNPPTPNYHSVRVHGHAGTDPWQVLVAELQFALTIGGRASR